MKLSSVIIGLVGIIVSLYMDKQGSVLACATLHASIVALILGILHPLFN